MRTGLGDAEWAEDGIKLGVGAVSALSVMVTIMPVQGLQKGGRWGLETIAHARQNGRIPSEEVIRMRVRKQYFTRAQAGEHLITTQPLDGFEVIIAVAVAGQAS